MKVRAVTIMRLGVGEGDRHVAWQQPPAQRHATARPPANLSSYCATNPREPM